MTNEQTVYNDLLNSFSSTLHETSKDDFGGTMIDCQMQVVCFDSFKDSISNGWNGRPKSCDALYRYDADMWFLIEFKNGSIEFENKKSEDVDKKLFRPNAQVFYGIIRKLFESLFLLTDLLGQTIEFTRKNLIFILVYNEEKNKNLENSWYQVVKNHITMLGHRNDILQMYNLSEILPDNPDNSDKSFNVSYFDKLYVKKAYVCSSRSFEEEFVKKYACES